MTSTSSADRHRYLIEKYFIDATETNSVGGNDLTPILERFDKTGDIWQAINANSHFREADQSGKGLSLVESIHSDSLKDKHQHSALLTTKGGSYRDLGRLSEAQDVAEKAHARNPKSFHPCTLLGAIHYELREFGLGDAWFAKAVERGAKQDVVDGELRSLLRRVGADKQREIADHLLRSDPLGTPGSSRFSGRVTGLPNQRELAVVCSSNGTLVVGHDFRIIAVDLENKAISAAWLALLDHYAHDPMGGGTGLSAYAKVNLVSQLKDLRTFHGALAFIGDEAVGLINCFAGFSTFAAKPLLNIHDIVTRDDRRGQGVGQALLGWAEQRARELGCCKLTLEVLSNNARAVAAYRRAGFAPYVLDPAAGHALFIQKPLLEN